MANILVVEDDYDLNYAYTIILKTQGHTVESVYNGEEAAAMLKQFKPDLILLDLLMPIKNGLEFLRDTAEDRTDPNMKVVVFTNLENAGQMNEALRLGANKCIVKAWTGPQGLIEIVDAVLRGDSTIRQTADSSLGSYDYL